MKSCLVCGSTSTKLKFQSKQFKIIQCQHCQFGWLMPYSSLAKLKDIYQKDYFDDKKSPEFKSDARKKLGFVKKFLPSDSKILDFGCAMGDFIEAGKQNGFQMSGYDVSGYAASQVENRYGVKTKSEKLAKNLFPQGYFDAIVSFDVIEHTTIFKQTLSFFYAWLKPRGLLFMTTPNIESWDAKLLGNKWYGYTKIPQHINYFSPRSMKMLLKESNFKLNSLQTWGFVRTLNYFLGQTKMPKIPLLGAIPFYLPMVDMMIVAQKA